MGRKQKGKRKMAEITNIHRARNDPHELLAAESHHAQSQGPPSTPEQSLTTDNLSIHFCVSQYLQREKPTHRHKHARTQDTDSKYLRSVQREAAAWHQTTKHAYSPQAAPPAVSYHPQRSWRWGRKMMNFTPGRKGLQSSLQHLSLDL